MNLSEEFDATDDGLSRQELRAKRRRQMMRRRRTVTILTACVLVLGVVVGLILESVWLGLTLAVIVSIGWLMAYESWRGRAPHRDDPWDDGAQL